VLTSTIARYNKYVVDPYLLSVKAVLFDLDATLANSRPIYDRAFATTFQEVFGIELGRQERLDYMGLPTLDFLKQYAEGEQLRQLTDILQAHVVAMMSEVELFSGLAEMLPELRQEGLLLGVVTSQNGEECEITRRHLQIDNWIDVWITADDVDQVKPHPRPVQAALDALSVEASRAVMVGDSVFDIKAGQAAGTRVAAAAWGAANLEQLLVLAPDFVFYAPQDLRKLISARHE
jgi:pyrophosphatase PpaX